MKRKTCMNILKWMNINLRSEWVSGCLNEGTWIWIRLNEGRTKEIKQAKQNYMRRSKATWNQGNQMEWKTYFTEWDEEKLNWHEPNWNGKHRPDFCEPRSHQYLPANSNVPYPCLLLPPANCSCCFPGWTWWQDWPFTRIWMLSST